MDPPLHQKPSRHEHDQDPGAVDDIRDRAPAHHGGARHRQRAEAVEDALVQVVGHADGRGRRGERDRLSEDAREQVLAVGAATGQRDRSAEHEREEQHEHHRLEDREDRQLGNTRDPPQIALGDDQTVTQRVAEAAQLLLAIALERAHRPAAAATGSSESASDGAAA